MVRNKYEVKPKMVRCSKKDVRVAIPTISLLYRVVPCALMPSAVISEAKIPYNVEFHYSNYLLFTHDGTRILHGSRDDTILVWDLSLWELIKILTQDISQVEDWACLLNDQIIVSGMSKVSYTFWDIISSTPIRFCTASQGSEGLDF